MLQMKKIATGLFTLFCALGPAHAPAQDNDAKGRVMFVLDGSNSMWGQIDGTAKIAIAKDVMTDLITNLDTTSDMGLLVYGHRRKDDCSDIELISLAGQVDRNKMIAKIQSIKPRGKTPITNSVRAAAGFMGVPLGRKSSIVVVSDGLETCGGDPCALAGALKSMNSKFTMHVVGFDVTKEEFATLQCMATQTGGKFFKANNAKELKNALAQTVAAVQSAPAKPLKPQTPKPSFHLYAKLCEKCDRSKPLDVLWNVQKNGADHFEGLGVLFDTDPKFEPGTYKVTARYANSALVREAEITVGKDGQQIGEVNLNGGGISLYAYAGDDEKLAPDQILYKFFPVKEGIASKTALDVAIQGGDVTWLPAGDYKVVAQHQTISESAEIEIIAGKTIEHTFDLQLGYFQPMASLAAGGEQIGNFTYRVFASREAAEKGGNGITSGTSKVSTKLALKAGEYWVETIYSPSNVSQVKRVFPITVTGNVLSTPIFSMNAGIVNFDVIGGSTEAFSFLLWIKKVNADGSDGPVVGKTTYRKDSAALIPGRYRLFEFYSKKQTDDFVVDVGQSTTFMPTLR